MCDSAEMLLDRWNLSELLQEQSGLRLLPIRNGALCLCGTLEFSAEKPGFERIEDEFEVEIVVPKNFPRALPVVTEVGGRIPATFHTFDEGGLCLGSPTRLLLSLRAAPTMTDFIKNCVVPYLYGFSYHQRHGEMPFGELAHGRQGLRDDFRELFGVDTDLAAIEMVRLAGLKKRIATKRPCPCGSGKRLGKCHNCVVNEKRRLLERGWFREQYRLLGRTS